MDRKARMEPRQSLLRLVERVAGRFSDRAYLTLRFRRSHKYWPRLWRPRSFNEHLLRYKLVSRGDPRLPRLADKISVKEEVAELIGRQHVIPTLWQGSELPPRPERKWPKPYILKSSHGSAQFILVRSADDENWDEIERLTAEWLSGQYRIGSRNREWHYAQIEPRLLVEPMIGDGVSPPPDYKFLAFGGRVELIWRDDDRLHAHRRTFYDRDWVPQPFGLKQPRGCAEREPPAQLREMIAIAEKLAADFEFVRVDLYCDRGRIYFGELTFFPLAGMGHFDPPEADFQVGRLWSEAAARSARRR